MKKTIFLGLILALSSVCNFAVASDSIPAFTTHNTVEFLVPSDTPRGDIIYFNVSSVEDTARDMLKKMGATHIEVTVYGGVSSDIVRDPYVHASFDSLRIQKQDNAQTPTNATWATVTLTGYEQGYLLDNLFNNVKGYFEIRDVHRTETGFNDNYTSRYDLSILLAQ